MITKKRKVSQIPSTTVLTQDSKILIVQNGTTATISALDILAGVSGISAAHLVDFNNPHQVTKAQIGLGNVDNTSDANKPVSTLVQSALNLKQDVLVSGTNIKTINGVSILGSGNIDLSSVAAVTSVNSKVGAVVLTTADISENSNLYYTNARVKAYADTLYPSLTGSYSNPSWITSIAWAKLSGTPTSLSGYGITDPVVFSNTVYGNPSFIGTLAWSKLIGTPTTLAGYGITDALTMTRTITINGVTQDLSSDRTWNVGDLVSSGSYNNPSWITSLNWSKIASTPTTLSGYGITDGVSTSGSYSNPSWITDLAFSKITGYSVPTLAQVTTAGATTTNFITVGGLTSNGSITASAALARGNYINNTLVASANNDVLVGLDINPTFNTGAYTGVINMGIRFKGDIYPSADNLYSIGSGSFRIAAVWGFQSIFSYYYAPSGQSAFFGVSGNTNINFPINNTVYGRFHATTGNFTLQNGGTFTDAGFRLDVNGTFRAQGEANVSFLSLAGNTAVNNSSTTLLLGSSGYWTGVRIPRYFEATGTITAASAIARGVYFNQTLTAAANNDVLVGLDINPTFTVGAFTGVTQIAIRVNGDILPSSDNTRAIGSSSNRFNSVYSAQSVIGTMYTGNIRSNAAGGVRVWSNNANQWAQWFDSTGNLLLQNGGTFTDAGYRLDVNGTARVQGILTATPASLTGSTATSILDLSQTWNTTGTPIAIKLNITDTASNNLSDLISLQVAGSPKFRVLKSGYFVHAVGGEINGSLIVGGNSGNLSSSAILQADSTLRGFLPPRMTTAQKTAISTPAAGLVVYDSTLNSLAVYNGTLWGPLITGVGTVTASSSLAQGVYISNTLVASANNDVLVGLEINPTFTNGAFTGVTNAALRVGGLIMPNANNTYDIGTTALRFKSLWLSGVLAVVSAYTNNLVFGVTDLKIQNTTGTDVARFFGTGNLVIQNGGTFTDAGFRLDVVGADARFNGVRAGLGAGSVIGNTVFGDSALNSNSTGSENTAFGYQVLKASTSNSNSVFGHLAGSSQTSGNQNHLFGRLAGYLITTGSNNAAFGFDALRRNVSGSGNVAIGNYSLANNTASSNTAFGYESGFTNTTGTGLTAVGYQALRASTGNNNTAFGYQAGLAISTGTDSVFIGYQTGIGTTTGIRNTAIGTYALNSNVTGSENVAVGRNALNLTTSGGNTAIGSSAGAANTTGTGLTAVGYQALTASIGNNNTAFGYQTGLGVSTGAGNSLFGYQSGTNLTTGSFNTLMGVSIVAALTSSSNTAVGYAITATGNSNTLFGRDINSGGFDASIVIGRGGSATASNQFVVGSATYPAGTITTAVAPVINEYWIVVINGVTKKIALIA